MSRSRVLIVDDSALMRELLTDVLRSAPDLEVVGTARDPLQARALIESQKPDVLTLDVEMPHCDGLTFLGELMRTRPMPVVMVSTLTERGSELALRALELGAIDVVEKPKLDLRAGIMLRANELISKVRAAASSRPRKPVVRAPLASSSVSSAASNAASAPRLQTAISRPSNFIGTVIAIGASTGGTEALAEVLTALPRATPPIVLVQHMPERFTGKFAARLDSMCRIRVKQAAEGDPLLPGTALLAPGGLHLRIERGPGSFVARLGRAPENAPHRPSVDVLFESVAASAGGRGIGAILTGMGADGARGLLAMRRAGARTVAQDEATCVVFGMPREALACGGAERALPLDRIARTLISLATSKATA